MLDFVKIFRLIITINWYKKFKIYLLLNEQDFHGLIYD